MILISLKYIFGCNIHILLVSVVFGWNFRGSEENQNDVCQHKYIEEALENLHLLEKVKVKSYHKRWWDKAKEVNWCWYIHPHLHCNVFWIHNIFSTFVPGFLSWYIFNQHFIKILCEKLSKMAVYGPLIQVTILSVPPRLHLISFWKVLWIFCVKASAFLSCSRYLFSERPEQRKPQIDCLPISYGSSISLYFDV